jgi:hypothetical protein
MCIRADGKESPMSNTYYLVRKQQLMREFYQAMKSAEQVLVSRYGPVQTESIIQQTRQEFESLLFHLPYIGGDDNPLTDTLIQSAQFLAIYRVLKSYGKPVEETGEVCYLMTEAALCSSPRVLVRLSGKNRFNRLSVGQLKQQAIRSQEREYPGDWVYQVVDGDGRNFDYGVDYTECAICKFYHAEDADELMPYVCLLDYPVSKALGTGMARTTTLADGAERCDFRFKPGRPVERMWPPKTVKA